MSGLINVLMLTGSLFMMQVYDRVLGSQSVPTLIALSLIAIAAYTFQGILDALRGRLLALIGERVDEVIGPKVYAAVTDLPLRLPRGAQESLQPFRDLDAIRMFLGGQGTLALFDLPWLPIYLLVMFLLHPVLGWVTVGGAGILIVLTILTEVWSKKPSQAAQQALSARNLAADAAQRNAEAVRAMGMLPALAERWQHQHDIQMQAQRRATFATGSLSVAARTFRMVLQSAMLGLGAYLSIRGQISAGTIIAASILSSRALAPIDLVIASWKGFQAARQGHQRLKQMLGLYPEAPETFALPAPQTSLAVDRLMLSAPGSREPIVKRANFALNAGQALGIIGPSASGKTSLGRGLVGVWAPLAGRVMLDGASLDQWDAVTLGQSIGYLPQDVQLFDGTLAENIARFQPDASSDAVIEAAVAAGFHTFAISFENGYQTRIGQGGAQLSAGQRQRVGLARALYGNPFLVVLDEPNSNLDSDGEMAVAAAIEGVRKRGGIAIVIAHRPSVISAVDMLMVMRDGEAVAFGPRDEILSKMVQNARNIIPHPAMTGQS